MLGEDHSQQMPKLTMKQRHEKLFEELDLSGLESWSPKLAVSTQSVLAEYHNITLEPSKLGCTHSIEHVIKVTKDTPFKEQFRWIPPPLVEEVCKHFQEMLDSGTYHPTQSMWCNAVVLVRKKDGGLHFCIDLQHLNAHTITRDPLTAVPMASMTVLPICPCLHRGFLWVWCHCMTAFRQKEVCRIAPLPIGLFYFPKWVTWLCCCFDWLIGQERSHDLIQKPLQFSTGLSSSGGIIWLKQGYSLLFSELFMCNRTWVSYVL